jgi:hypothetical protein
MPSQPGLRDNPHLKRGSQRWCAAPHADLIGALTLLPMDHPSLRSTANGLCMVA